MAFTSKPPDKFSRYTDATGELSNKSLTAGEWYVSHKILLRNILIGVLLVWVVISVGYSLIAWGSYAVSGYFQDRALARRQITQFQNYEVLQQAYKATPLDFEAIQIFTPTEGKYDLVTFTTNKNSRFVVKLDYSFTYEGGKTETKHVSLLPLSRVPVAVLGVESESYPGNPTLKVEKVGYERVSEHAISDVGEYIKQRTNFTIENPQFLPPQEGVPASRLTFDILNNTLYGFWEPFFYVEILSGGETLGMVSLTVPDFKAGERRSIDLSTFIDLGSAEDIRLVPMLDVFDTSVYK